MTVAALCAATSFSQDGQRWSSSRYLSAPAKPDVTVAFDVTAVGKRFEPTWGLDQAAIDAQVIKKGINHMGIENIGIGRTAFRFTDALVNDSVLPQVFIDKLRERNTNLNLISPTLPILLTADQEASEKQDGNTPDYYVKNKVANIAHWAAMINSHVHWLQANTQHPILGVSPFNEGDYWTLEEGASPELQWKVAKELKDNYPRFADIKIVGGNTLNDDKALDWYTTGKQYYDWGNTHQLAGSFDNFAKFYKQLAADGKVGYGDEMHNVVEAMVGLEYGMTVGIWWGFDSRARGEFCQISRNGERLAYGEHRDNWTAASVWRHDDGRVKAFLGSSERQAKTTSYQFASKDRLVYYDGYGPQREFAMTVPGGMGYQNGQANAERVIDITWGADVPVAPVTAGVYRLVNKNSSNVAVLQTDNIGLASFSATSKSQLWNIAPSSSYTSRWGGDFSFYDITSATNSAIRMNVLNFATSGTVNVIPYDKNTKADTNEQWYLEYAGDGFYYIRCRESALYLAAAGTTNVVQTTLPSNVSDRNSLQWRIIPDSVTAFDRVPPSKVSDLKATSLAAAVTLTWTANSGSTNKDLAGYLVFRAEKGSDEWNTIGRMIQGTTFTDNTCRPGVTYLYKVKAVDQSQNRSRVDSDVVEGAATGERALVAWWPMDGSVDDTTDNMMDARVCGTPNYTDGNDGTKALFLRGTSGQYLQLPYEVAGSQELTVAMWVNVRNGTAWQRLFDFGADTDHYLFLTPNNGSVMRFAIKNGGDEQTLDGPKLTTLEWKHVVLTLGADKTALYVDGKEVASTTAVTIRPSDVKPFLNYIGRSQFVADPLLNAFVDDVRIYNYAVTASDVQTIMDGGQPTAVRPVVANPASADVYDLQGVRRSAVGKGVVISGGRKVLKKQ